MLKFGVAKREVPGYTFIRRYLIGQGGYEPTITGNTNPEPRVVTDMVNATIELVKSSGI
ncbi:MAG: hypothetical protein IJ299_03590 [Oscillospiraceae bacterium]|nr:hypothetical protein [Oscillospiraceae bacterium]